MGALADATSVGLSDSELVTRVRGGDDAAFEELYRRYARPIAAFVWRKVGDEARAEDIRQEAFLSALRALRASDSEIAFRPWIYEIASNAAIDHYRRANRAEEVSLDAGELLRPADRRRLVGSRAPDAALIEKERLEHLQGAIEELSDTHHRILVMRELEGLSYREIGERLELTRPAVESTLFRARRRLEHEYNELDTGRRCQSMHAIIGSLAEGMASEAEARRLRRHALRCAACRRHARQLGVEPLRRRLAARAAALLPLPAFLRSRISGAASGGASSGGGEAAGTLGGMLGSGGHLAAAIGQKAATIVAAAALAGAGGAVLGGAVHPLGGGRAKHPPSEHRVGGHRAAHGRVGASALRKSSTRSTRSKGTGGPARRAGGGPGRGGPAGAHGLGKGSSEGVGTLRLPGGKAGLPGGVPRLPGGNPGPGVAPGSPRLPSIGTPSIDAPSSDALHGSGVPPRVAVPLDAHVPEAPGSPQVPDADSVGGADVPDGVPRVDQSVGGLPDLR